jgi:probable rRNA maturation factor
LKARRSPPKNRKRPLSILLSVKHNARSQRALSEARLRQVARRAMTVDRKIGRYAVALAFVSDLAMQRLNRDFAGNDYLTDVLSFPAREDTGAFQTPHGQPIFLGDIAIAIPQAARQARAAGHPLQREIELLLAHGILHLLGHDHATRREREYMDALQASVLSML